MRSATKVEVDRPTLETLVREVLGTESPVADVRPLTDGMFNAAYAVALADGSRAVVKVAPPAGTPLLTYEQDLMPAEVDFFRRAAGVVPVPQVLGVDLTRRHVDRDVLVLQHLDGAPLHNLRRELKPEQTAAVRRELGGAVARLRTVSGTRFGYDRPDGALSADRWSAAFAAMVDALLADAERYGVRLPRSAAGLSAQVAAAAPELDTVEVPVLTHFDLWAGNVFVARSGGTARLEALIDGERAFWGDPLAELASTALFANPAKDFDFLDGYAQAAGEPLVLDDRARLRLALYRTYLYLIMTIEAAPRGYSGAEAVATAVYVRKKLKRELKTLRASLG